MVEVVKADYPSCARRWIARKAKRRFKDDPLKLDASRNLVPTR